METFSITLKYNFRNSLENEVGNDYIQNKVIQQEGIIASADERRL